jgi:hypothetical protein
MLTSYNGWQASKDPDEIRITSYKVEGTNLKLRCAEGLRALASCFRCRVSRAHRALRCRCLR